MPQDSAVYRIGLIEAVILLVLLVLAFGAITIMARERWLALGVAESLLARLAAAAVVASVAVTGLSNVVLNLVQGIAFSDSNLALSTARNQAVVGIVLALGLAAVSIIRIEMYHRRLANRPVQEEDADWKVEPPDIAGRR
jgi:hypothetical protein